MAGNEDLKPGDPDQKQGSAPESPSPEIDLAKEVERLRERFAQWRQANHDGYMAADNRKFNRVIDPQIRSQKGYLYHQLEHSQRRIGVLTGEDPEVDVWEDAPRKLLITRFDQMTDRLLTLLGNANNLGQEFEFIPFEGATYLEKSTGFSILNKLVEHEAYHGAKNMMLLAHHHVAIPKTLEATFGHY